MRPRECAPPVRDWVVGLAAEGEFSYATWGQGGLSWAIPYAAGTLALGWQVNPDMTAQQAKDLLLQTATQTSSGAKVINPAAFAEAARQQARPQ